MSKKHNKTSSSEELQQNVGQDERKKEKNNLLSTETSDEKTETETSGEKTETETSGEKTETETSGEKTETETSGEKTETETSDEKTETETSDEKTETETSDEKTETETIDISDNILAEPAFQSNKKSKVLAVGDLHGDYFRLIRFLKEEELITVKNKDVFEWNPEAKNVNVVTLGDYCDWRGEPLEGPITEWIYGAKKILDFLINLSKQLAELKAKDKDFSSNLYCLLGNHDQMLLEGYESYKFFSEDDIKFILENASLPNMLIQEFSSQREKVEMILKFLNWYQQGGEKTIASYGGIKLWDEEMQKGHKAFLNNLILGTVVNKTLFSHSLPDSNQYWKPLDEILSLPDEEKAEAIMEFTWGRKIWGYDVFSGQPVLPLSNQQVENMLSQMNVERAVVGHTPMRSLVPVIVFNGKIINLDLHGIPGSKTLVEEFDL